MVSTLWLKVFVTGRVAVETDGAVISTRRSSEAGRDGSCSSTS